MKDHLTKVGVRVAELLNHIEWKYSHKELPFGTIVVQDFDGILSRTPTTGRTIFADPMHRRKLAQFFAPFIG